MAAVHVHVDSPMVTKERFAELTGMPIGTVNDKVLKGELPVIRLNLGAAKRGAVYINMAKLAELAASAEFLHPGLKTTARKLNTK